MGGLIVTTQVNHSNSTSEDAAHYLMRQKVLSSLHTAVYDTPHMRSLRTRKHAILITTPLEITQDSLIVLSSFSAVSGIAITVGYEPWCLLA